MVIKDFSPLCRWLDILLEVVQLFCLLTFLGSAWRLVQLTVSVSLLVLACPFPCITLLYEYLSDVIEQECD